MASIPAPEHTYTVTMRNPVDGEELSFARRAAYFVEDGAYTLFKDRTHAVCAAYRTDLVLTIAREATHDGQA